MKIFGLNDPIVTAGLGLRCEVFVSGCPLNCVWCHNPQCREMGIDFSLPTLDGIDVTFSGGEPLIWHDEIPEGSWIETSMSVPVDSFQKYGGVIADLKTLDCKTFRKYIGEDTSLMHIIQHNMIKASRETNHFWIRILVIRDVNARELSQLITYACDVGAERIELIRYVGPLGSLDEEVIGQWQKYADEIIGRPMSISANAV